MGDISDIIDEFGNVIGGIWDEGTDFLEDVVEDVVDPFIPDIPPPPEMPVVAPQSITSVPSTAADIRADRKDKLAALSHKRAIQEASDLKAQKGGAVGKVAGMRTTRSGMQATSGKTRRRIRAQKYKGRGPLRLGMKRPT